MIRAEAYLRAKFHLYPSNRLATIHRRLRQTDWTDRTANGLVVSGEPSYKRLPKNDKICMLKLVTAVTADCIHAEKK